MEESIYRQRQTVQRLFGPSATLGGSIGSGRHPGVLTISLGGRPLGSGRTMQEAIGDATRRQTSVEDERRQRATARRRRSLSPCAGLQHLAVDRA